MTRVTLAAIVIVACSVLVTRDSPAHAGDDRADPPASQEVFNIGNREEPTETQLLVIAKSFCVEMRGYDDPVDSKKLRYAYIDPLYLEGHGLDQGEFPVRTLPLVPTPEDDIEVAADRRSIVYHMGTAEEQREIILFKATVNDGNLFFLPAQAPDPESGAVTPWILRMKLD